MISSEYPKPYGDHGWFIVYPGTIEKKLGVTERIHSYEQGDTRFYLRVEVTEIAYSTVGYDGIDDGVEEESEFIETLIYRPVMKCWGRGLSLKRGANHA